MSVFEGFSASTAAVDIVIPVHNSPEDVRRCLSACRSTLRGGDSIIVVDDGSGSETATLCASFAESNPHTVRLIRHEIARRFTRAANAGIAASTADQVVVLNSDTVPAGDWIERLCRCLQSGANIGVVGPLSNAGGWQSIPSFGPGGPPNNRVRSDDRTIADIHAFCGSFLQDFDYPFVEQINGFCMAIRRDVLSAVGPLDEESFPEGYGEEVDFNFRVQNAGYLMAVAIDVFVYHDKTKSYTSEQRKALIARGRERNDERHGATRVKDAVTGTQRNPILAEIRDRAAIEFKRNGWILDVDA